jgi:hypothetical protein
MLMAASESTFEILDAISRTRSLTQSETRRLEYEVRRNWRSTGIAKRWTAGDISRLRRYLMRGKKPAQIAILMGRTERAVWRRIYKLGWTVRGVEKGSIALMLPNVGK